ncbi:MAG: thioredoxin-like domain-containing protein, partial [Bacteroidota bacterium]
ISYTPVFHSKIEYFITKVTPQVPDSINRAIDYLIDQTLKSRETSKWCIYWITDHYEKSQYMGMDAVFVHMVDKYYKDTTRTFWIDETLRFKITDRADNLRNNLLGKIAPNLNMPDTGFTMRAIHDIKAKYTMLLFWDATCGRCKEEIPRLKVLYDKLNKEQYLKGLYFQVYAISMTTDAEEWKKYVRDNKLKWLNVSDLYNNTKYRKFYDIYSTPVIYLLNEKKEIIAKRLSVEQVEEFIEKGIE